MTSFDIIVITIVLGSGLMAFFRGLTREVLGLIAWIASGLVAYFSVQQIGDYARQHIANPMMADSLTAITIFLVFLILFTIVSHVVSHHIQDSALGGVDRSLGFAYGLARGGLVILAFDMILSFFIARPDYPAFLTQGRFRPLVTQYAIALQSAFPDSLVDRLPEGIQDFFKKNVLLDSANKILQDNIENLGEKFEKTEQSADDVEAMVGNLAQMKPQQSQSQPDGEYRKSHQQDMNRLFQTAQGADEQQEQEQF